MRIAYAAPRKVGDVHQSVYAAKVNEHTIRCDVLDSTFQNLAFLQVRDNLLALCLKLSLDKSLVRNNHVAEFLVNLNNLELHGLAHEDVVVADRMNINLAAGQECLDAKHVYNHTALSAALDVALDNLILFESLVNALPALLQTSLLV